MQSPFLKQPKARDSGKGTGREVGVPLSVPGAPPYTGATAAHHQAEWFLLNLVMNGLFPFHAVSWLLSLSQ